MTDFRLLFGRSSAVVASAPGRVNLMGEHTDYNDGFVLPTVLPHATTVELAARTDGIVRVASANATYAGSIETYRLTDERPGRRWVDYVQGITVALRETGARLGGFDARITSSVPIGAGLSSSAALEIALLRGLRMLFTLSIDDVTLARLGQRAETEFVGAHTGIMDQMAVSLCPPGFALLLDTHTLDRRLLGLPPTIGLVVIHSGVVHDHAHGDYNQRRTECEEAARRLGVPSLRHLDASHLPRVAALPEPFARRVGHVMSENARVAAAAAALEAGDGPALGRLFLASHASQRDDFDVSTPDVDRLVALASSDPAIWGARLTGGGFGGAVVIALPAAERRPAGRRIADVYAQATGRRATIILPES